jgi:hypothetical protein
MEVQQPLYRPGNARDDTEAAVLCSKRSWGSSLYIAGFES